MKVVILCGGFGTRLREETDIKPKPMVEIGGRPILWHIMKTFAHYGFTDFVLCLGYKSSVIKDYFLNYMQHSNDFTIHLGTGDVEVHNRHQEQNWQVTMVETGLNAMTGARLKRVEDYLDGEEFILTYGDGVIDLDINSLVKYHRSTGKVGTVTGVSPRSHYGELDISDGRVLSFQEKPKGQGSYISGGYFVLKREFIKTLSNDESLVLEREPLERLAARGELSVYTHTGFWQCMDTYRDYQFLNELWNNQDAPWRVWHS